MRCSSVLVLILTSSITSGFIAPPANLLKREPVMTRKPSASAGAAVSLCKPQELFRLRSVSLDETMATISILPREYSTFAFRDRYKVNYDVSSSDPSKPPVLLIHGFGGSINHWRYNEPYLTSLGYNVIRVDLLGFGASDKPAPSEDIEYSMEVRALASCEE